MVSWNVRGINDARKRVSIINLLKSWKPDVVCLQETKMENISVGTIQSLWGGPFTGWVVLPAFGTSGGILLMWDKRVVECLEEAVGSFFISCKFKSVMDQFVWAFSGVYDPIDNSERPLLWEELSGVFLWWDILWCFGGDFNVTRFSNERTGAHHSTFAMGDFSDFISKLGLLDLPLTGGSFTWSNNQVPSSMFRIDRFLVSPLWEEHFPDLLQRHLPRPVSDHFPLLLDCGGLTRGSGYFKFENMWLKVEGFAELVKQWWDSYHYYGTPKGPC
jgi:hypothetical protein